MEVHCTCRKKETLPVQVTSWTSLMQTYVHVVFGGKIYSLENILLQSTHSPIFMCCEAKMSLFICMYIQCMQWTCAVNRHVCV